MVTSRIRLRHLRVFLEIVRQQSIGRAADVLNITQPAISKTLRELEDILGKALFEKDGRGIKITRYGEVFSKHAGAALTAVQAGVDSLEMEFGGPPLRIGALPTVSARVMPRVMKLYLKESIENTVKIVTGENIVLLEQLRRGELDLVIGRLAAADQMSGLAFDYLYSEKVVFVVREGHPLFTDDNFDFSRIREFTVLMPTPASVIRPYVDQYLLAMGLGSMPMQIETVSDSFGRAFVFETDAIWVISEGVVARDLNAGRMKVLPMNTDETRGAVGLTSVEGSVSHGALDIFRGIVREVVGEITV